MSDATPNMPADDEPKPQPTVPWPGAIPFPPLRQPFRCPVCNGIGKLGFYQLPDFAEAQPPGPCHACGGKGIVWG